MRVDRANFGALTSSEDLAHARTETLAPAMTGLRARRPDMSSMVFAEPAMAPRSFERAPAAPASNAFTRDAGRQPRLDERAALATGNRVLN